MYDKKGRCLRVFFEKEKIVSIILDLAKRNKNKVAFTMTELIVALLILVLVGAVISKEAISQTKRKANIEKIQSTYSLLEKATMAWQAENNCYEDVRICVENARASGITSNEIFNGPAKYLPVVASSNTIDAKGRHVEGENFNDIKWLPYSTTTLYGNPQTDSTIGVSKYYDVNSKNIAYYKLRNGVTIAVNFMGSKNTGYGFFDINGAEGQNRIGSDVYPFSIGADIYEGHRLYNAAAKKFSPYFASERYDSLDICNIINNNCTNEKLITNPTVYVLRWSKLP